VAEVRGAVSLASAVLFMAVAAALAVIAAVVNMIAQGVLEDDAQAAAQSAADFVASQIRDAVLCASVPGVVSVRKDLLVPGTFYGFDSAAAAVCVGNKDGNIYVNVTLSAARGSGVARAAATAWVFNITDGKVVLIEGSYAPCPGAVLPRECVAGSAVNLTRPGCAAAIFNGATIYLGPP
jgi:hypothetical protein